MNILGLETASFTICAIIHVGKLQEYIRVGQILMLYFILVIKFLKMAERGSPTPTLKG